jgi:hypothetical protein
VRTQVLAAEAGDGAGLTTDHPLGLVQIVTDVGVPAEGTPDGLEPVVAPQAPALRIRQALLDRPLEGAEIGHINQQAIGGAGQDVPGATVIGGDDRQATGRSLQQGQPEGFGQGRVDEHAPQP